MRRPKLFAVLAITGIVALFVLFLFESGPWYQGRPLSYWLKGFESQNPAVRAQSANAVRHMGKRAVPALIARLKHKPPIRPSWWNRILSRFWRVSRPGSEHFDALAALDALGPAGNDAIPGLENLLHEDSPDLHALLILARIGPDALPVLKSELTNDQKSVRVGARASLELIQSNSEIVFPKDPVGSDFLHRTADFNIKVLNTSFQEYRAEHPEQFSGGGLPQ